MSSASIPAHQKELFGHPVGLYVLFFTEMWERFSFYGMRALLTLYLIKDYYAQLENSEEIAYGIYAAYGALVYLTPLLGGYLADKYIGYRKSILFGGILMALGHFFMAFPTPGIMDARSFRLPIFFIC